MLIVLLLDIMVIYAFGDSWYEPGIIMIILVVQILTLNYELKSLFEITKMDNPDTYMTFSLGFLISIFFEIMVYLVI